MDRETAIKLFEDKRVRVSWDAEQEKWFFSIIDVMDVLTNSIDASAYWRKLKERMKKEGNQTVTNCHGLKMVAAASRMRMTNVANTEKPLMLIEFCHSREGTSSSSVSIGDGNPFPAPCDV